MSEDGEPPVPEVVRRTVEGAEYPELSIREVMDRADLSEDQVVGAAGRSTALKIDLSMGVVRLAEDDGGEFIDDRVDDLLSDGRRIR